MCGRICTMATMGYLQPVLFGEFAGYLSAMAYRDTKVNDAAAKGIDAGMVGFPLSLAQ